MGNKKFVYELSQLYLFESIKGEKSFDRSYNNECVKGVYFWGFNLNKNSADVPKYEEDIVIYYVGKSEKNIKERIMQEITQLIFGGFGTIINHKYLEKNKFRANLYEIQESTEEVESKDGYVLYKSNGLHVLHHFLNREKESDLHKTIEWMQERLLFGWIEVKAESLEEHSIEEHSKINESIEEQSEKNETIEEAIRSLETEFHKILRTNVFGNRFKKLIGTKLLPSESKKFKEINWKEYAYLKDYFEKVNKNIPLKSINDGVELFEYKHNSAVEIECNSCQKKIIKEEKYYYYKKQTKSNCINFCSIVCLKKDIDSSK